MDHLPWLVVYGAFVWPVALGVTVVATLAISLSLKSRRVRRRANEVFDTLPEPVTNESNLALGEHACIEGALIAQFAQSLRRFLAQQFFRIL